MIARALSLFFLTYFLTPLWGLDLVDKQDAVLSFWLGPINTHGEWSEYYAKRWFQSSREFDEEVVLIFERDVENAALGKFYEWKESAKGRLALIILLDQFPRNIYRGTPRAFAYDQIALSLCLEGIEKHQDEELCPIERKFFYMPLMHAEERAIQEKSVKIFKRLADSAPETQKGHFETTLSFAKLHYQIVDQFGRFPHRNLVLGRTPTKDEEEYLNESQESFGQKAY
jgi:uncharacterized protein (DUF924 family)